MSDFEDTIDGLAAVALGVFLAAIIIHGNLKPFLAEVTKETGFIEFIVAIFIIYEISKVEALEPVSTPLIAAAIIILVLRIISGTDSNAFNDFSSGKINLFGLAARLFTNQA